MIPSGFEPETHSLEGCCSIQLSYGTVAVDRAVGWKMRKPDRACKDNDFLRNFASMKKLLYISVVAVAVGVAAVLLTPKERYVVMVSMDGFRWDYPALYSCPNVDAVAENGVWTDMYPSYPASTFPNHYAMATGLVPDHNGIVNNSFWNPETEDYYSMGGPNRHNPEYFLGEPIWLTAQRQGVKTGVVYWVGSDVAVQGQYPTYWKNYEEKPLLEYSARIDTVEAYLNLPKKDRPRLIMVYFDEPDHSGHGFGPESEQVGKAVALVDEQVGRLREAIARSKVGKRTDLILVSDHGMTEIDPRRCIHPSDWVRPEWYERLLAGTPTSIFTKPEFRDSVYNAFSKAPHVTVWRKEDIPLELNYGSSPRIGDIVVAPDLGWQIHDRHPRGPGGAHGYSPYDKDMQAIFRAEGPDFKKGKRVDSFRNVTLYPLVCHLLGIEPAPNDGDLEEVRGLLR